MASNCLESDDRWIVRTTEDAVRLLLDFWGTDNSQERLVVMMLDGEHRVLGSYLHDIGSGALKRLQVESIVRRCIQVDARHLVIALFRTYPDVSISDVRLTDQLVRVLGSHGFGLIDALILSGEAYYISLRERGLRI